MWREAYRTVSYDAIILVACMTSIDFMVRKRLEAFLALRGRLTGAGRELNDFGPHYAPLGTRAFTMERWIQRLEIASPYVSSSRGWIHELNPPAVLPHWLGSSSRKVSYRLTQILTGHGCFNVFLYRICRVSSPLCIFGVVPEGDMTGLEDRVAHTLVDSTAFDKKRAALVRQIDAFVPGDLVSRMVESPSSVS